MVFIASANKNRIDSLSTVIENSIDTVKSDALIQKALIFYHNQKYYNAIKLIKEAIEIVPDDNIRLAKANNFIGSTYYYLGNYPKALEFYFKSLKYAELVPDNKLVAISYNGIGLTYAGMENNEKALDFFERALSIEQVNNNTENIGMLLHNIGDSYFEMGDYQKALDYLLQCETIINKSTLNKTILWLSIGEVYLNLNNYQESKKYYEKAIKQSQEVDNNNYNLSLSYQSFAFLYLSESKYSLALTYFYKSIELSKKISANEILKTSYDGLVNLFYLTNKKDSIVKYRNLYVNINNNIFNQQAAEKIADIQSEYKFEKQEAEIRNLLIENQLADKNQKLSIGVFILIIFIVIIIFLIVLYKQRKRLTDKIAVKQNIKIINYEDYIDKTAVKTDDSQIQKTNSSTLNDEYKTVLELSISKKIRQDKLYLKNDFTLNELANLLGTNRRYVSQVINERFEQNFNSFINSFRVKAAMRILSSSDYKKYTIETIAKMVGFKSVSAFNNAFKKNTGITPSVFVKNSLIYKNDAKTNSINY